MQIPRDAVLLRIFFGEDDKFHNQPLHEAIVLKARELHLGGATVLRGHIGFGHSSHIHTTKILRLSQDLPVIVEIVDSKEKIDAFLPVLDGMMSSGLVTIEKVQVLQYGEDEANITAITRRQAFIRNHCVATGRNNSPDSDIIRHASAPAIMCKSRPALGRGAAFMLRRVAAALLCLLICACVNSAAWQLAQAAEAASLSLLPAIGTSTPT